MEPIQRDLVSIIGCSYFQPIADLIRRLSVLPTLGTNDVKVNPDENGYSVSIILLLVSMCESYVMRVRYINRILYPIKKISVVRYIQDLYPDYRNIDALSEVFSLRDLIAHNHLWEIDFTWAEEPGMTLINAKLEKTAGDKKYHNTTDEPTRKTKTLALNSVPIKVGRDDVHKAFKVVWNTLIFWRKKIATNAMFPIAMLGMMAKQYYSGSWLKR